MLKLKMYLRWFTNYLIARFCCFGSYAFSPRILSIETTERCNLNCIMCPRNHTSLSKEELTLKQFQHILSLFPSINTVILLGRGETFMMREIFPILDFGSRKGIHFTIITNGTLLSAETIRKLPDTGKLLVSIDHSLADKYKEIRKGGDLNLIISNLKELKKIKPQQWVCIQSVIMNSNADYLEDFIKLAKDVSADAIKFMQPMIFDREMSSIYVSPSDISLKLSKAKKLAKNSGIRFVAVPQMNKPRVCVEPWFELRVSLNGDVYPCCYIYNSSSSSWCEWHQNISLTIPQSSYIMGNIYSDSANKIWNGEGYQSLRRKIITTKKNTLISYDHLNALRNKIDISKRFSYCSVCLYRQNKVC